MTGCRIGKVKFKSGAEVTVIEDFREKESKFMAATRRSAAAVDVDGYIVIGIGADGTYNIQWNLAATPITPSLAPSWIKDIMLREITEIGTLEQIEYKGE